VGEWAALRPTIFAFGGGGSLSPRIFAWLELLNSNGEVQARWPVKQEGLLLGRAYDCDVLLDDACCAPYHVRIAVGEQGVVFEDLGSLNGIQDASGRALNGQQILAQEAPLNVGDTKLRLRSVDFRVAPEQLRASRPAYTWKKYAPWFGLLLVLELVEVWLSATAELKLTSFLAPLISITAVVFGWAGIWSLLSRLFSREARYAEHLRLAFAALLSFSVVNALSGFVGFMGLVPSVGLVTGVLAALIAAALVYGHLLKLGSGSKLYKQRLVLGVLVLGLATVALRWYENRDRSGGPDVDLALKPPQLRLRSAVSVSEAFSGLDQQKQAIEEARKKPLSPLGDFGSLFEDAED
jgi:hypothetical protein